jgi:catechol 2,3-dioxygenase-like lactoylglutathione lyase family enzyme
MPIAHTSILVSDYAASKAFYAEALAPLNYKVAMEFAPHAVGFGGPNGNIDFWLHVIGGKTFTPNHLAFAGESEEMVQGFHEAAL